MCVRALSETSTMQMDEDFCSRKDGKKNSARNSIEIPDDEDVEEVELSPVETIIWDCCEVYRMKTFRKLCDHCYVHICSVEGPGCKMEEVYRTVMNYDFGHREMMHKIYLLKLGVPGEKLASTT